MKLTIIKKKIKEGISDRTGSQYRIASLFVKFDDKETYDKIVSHLRGKGASDEQIEKFCKPSEYKGKINYAFGLNCSSFTFDKVEQFGELDANVNFTINDQGFINARIHVVDRREQVNGYTPPESEIEGWASQVPDPVVSHYGQSTPSTPQHPYPYEANTIPDNPKRYDIKDDLPF